MKSVETYEFNISPHRHAIHAYTHIWEHTCTYEHAPKTHLMQATSKNLENTGSKIQIIVVTAYDNLLQCAMMF